jgi:exopolysaccharide biosynthesis polyprenyl glycosylphosphotransferase
MRRVLLTSDVAALVIAVFAAHAVFATSAPEDASNLLITLVALPAWVVGAKLFALYDLDAAGPAHSTVDELTRIFLLSTVTLFLSTQLANLRGEPLRGVGALWLLTIALVAGLRVAARAVSRRRAAYAQRTVIAGAGDIGQLVARKILRHREYGIDLVGFVDARPKDLAEPLRRVPILGGPEALAEIVRTQRIERVIVAFSDDGHDSLLALVRSLCDSRVHIDIVPRLFDVVGPRATIHSLEGLPLVGLPVPRLSRSSALLKRTFDLVGAGVGLLLLLPLFAVVALAIKLDSKGPVFFRQTRIGSGTVPFTIYKFRTMVQNADELKSQLVHLNKHFADGGDPRMFKIPSDPRCTRVGTILRRYSIDELPQLINVVKGDMTLVGPRPLIPEEHAFVDGWAKRRSQLKPGVTGLWQVLGRDDIPFAEMVTLDYLYVVDWSLLGDIKLVLQTIPVLFRHRAVH